jgi:hypothetical protein
MIVKAQQGCLEMSARADETRVDELLNGLPAWVEKTNMNSDLSGDKCLTQEKNASLSERVY